MQALPLRATIGVYTSKRACAGWRASRGWSWLAQHLDFQLHTIWAFSFFGPCLFRTFARCSSRCSSSLTRAWAVSSCPCSSCSLACVCPPDEYHPLASLIPCKPIVSLCAVILSCSTYLELMQSFPQSSLSPLPLLPLNLEALAPCQAFSILCNSYRCPSAAALERTTLSS